MRKKVMASAVSLVLVLGGLTAPARAAESQCLESGSYSAGQLDASPKVCSGVQPGSVLLAISGTTGDLSFPPAGTSAIYDFDASSRYSEVTLSTSDDGSLGVLLDGAEYGAMGATAVTSSATTYPGCGASGYALFPYTWSTTWNWRYNPASHPNAGALTAIQEAANLWSAGANRCTGAIYQSRFTNSYQGTTTLQGSATAQGTCAPADGISVVSWGQLPTLTSNGTVLALTCPKVYATTAVEADITFNSAIVFYTGSAAGSCPANSFDLREIAAHEVGHVTGLAHSTQSLSQLMKPLFNVCETGERLLAPGDIAGLLSRY